MPIAEIRVRRFFTSEEADVAPSVTILFEMKDGAPHPDKSIADLIERANLDPTFPATGIREMTGEEVEAFRADERE